MNKDNNNFYRKDINNNKMKDEKSSKFQYVRGDKNEKFLQLIK